MFLKSLYLKNRFLMDRHKLLWVISVLWSILDLFLWTVLLNHTVNALLFNFCKFDQKKSLENANCSVMISKLYCTLAKKKTFLFVQEEVWKISRFCLLIANNIKYGKFFSKTLLIEFILKVQISILNNFLFEYRIISSR